MVEKISIAFDVSPPFLTGEEKRKGMKLLGDLQIDRAVRQIIFDSAARESFLSVLCRPLPAESEAMGRREVMELFYAHPILHERLTELGRRLTVSKRAWDSERSRLLSSRKVTPGDHVRTLENAKGMLILDCHFLRIVLSILSEINNTVDHYSANRGYLGRLRNACAAAADGEKIAQLVEFADQIEKNLPNALTYDVDFSVDSEFLIESFLLADFSFVPRVREKKQKKGLFSFLTSKEPTGKEAVESKECGVSVPSEEGISAVEIAGKAVTEFDRQIYAMTKALLERFSSLEEEMSFYKGCVSYMEFLESIGIRSVFPQLSSYDNNTLKLTGLYDLLLLAERKEKETVVWNDADIGRSGETVGMLVMGENNSGKTVFLRSVGTAVLLGQNGLPVPCERGEISLRRRILTHFAKAEGELLPMSQAGRFEEEAAEMAEIVREMESESLLLLNETFQTTSYDEGAEGMYHILRHLTGRGCGFVFVTHLTKLSELCRGEAILARTENDPDKRYKIRIE